MTEIFHFLLSMSDILKDIEKQTIYGDAPLHIAAANITEQACAILLEKHVNVNIKNSWGMTALHVASEQGRVENVRLLLTYRSNVNAADANGNTALHYAALSRFDPLAGIVRDEFDVDTMLSFNHNDQRTENIDLNQWPNVSERLFEYWKKIGIIGGYDKLKCPINAKKQIAKMLVESGAVVDARNKFGAMPFHAAVYKEDEDLVKMLIEKYNVNIDAVTNDGATPLHFSAFNSEISVAQILLRKKANVHATYTKAAGTTALHYACKAGRTEIVEILLHHGADIEARIHSSGSTPLHCASAYGHADTVHVLLHYGADVDAKRSDGETALYIAWERPDNTEVIRVLLYYGADVDFRSPFDDALLHDACVNQKSTNIDYLGYIFECGPDINIGRFQSLLRTELADISGMRSIVIDEHTIKMEAIDRYVGDENWENVKRYKGVFENACKKEVVKLKESKISGNISYYDILTRDGNQVAIYTRNNTILHAMDTREYVTMFPIFRNMLYYRFKKSQKREVLLEPSVNSFNCLVGYQFPLTATMKVTSYLSNEDLKNFIEAYPIHGDTICAPKRADMEEKLPINRSKGSRPN